MGGFRQDSKEKILRKNYGKRKREKKRRLKKRKEKG